MSVTIIIFENPELCKLEHKTGRCRASKTRWFFDTSVGKCQEFTYGGCDGNANRFLTAERCDATCLAVFTPVYTQGTSATIDSP